MYPSYIMRTIARQQMEENARIARTPTARRAISRTASGREPRTFRISWAKFTAWGSATPDVDRRKRLPRIRRNEWSRPMQASALWAARPVLRRAAQEPGYGAGLAGSGPVARGEARQASPTYLPVEAPDEDVRFGTFY